MNTQDKKIVDANDFWLIKDNPMTKIGVFPYLGRQISPELEPDKIYQVLRPEEELTKPETLESLKLIPLVDEHTMLGTQPGFQPAEEKGVHGVTGTNVTVDKPVISNDLKVFSESLKEEISDGKKGLSLGYTCDYELTSGEYNGQHYDAVQKNIIFNHIALVDEGRMGKDVRVMDKSITYDSIADILQTKENNMAEENKTAQDVDKRELIREVMAIAAKPDSDFEGGEEEKIETIAKKLEQLSYNPSESGANDEDDTEPADIDIKEGEDEDPENNTPCGDEEEDEQKTQDEDPKEDEPKESEDEDIEEEKEGVSMDEAIKYIAKRDALVKKVRQYVGDSSKYSSMTIPEVVEYACGKLDIKPSLDALEGYLKAKSQIRAKISMDSAFTKPAVSSVLQQYKNGK